MLKTKEYEFWFVTGSQHLYGEDAIKQVEDHSKKITCRWEEENDFSYKVVNKPVVTTSDAIRRVCIDASSDENCAGVITWMHTFSPAKMWIAGLKELKKPLLHLHTQFNRDIPWESIDMDFMNLNQSAHGDREYGFIGARMNIARKIIVGHWEDAEVKKRLSDWMRTSVAYTEGQHLKVARFGDNMREVAVTEGDKVEAQIKFGWSVHGYGVGDLVQRINDVSEQEVDHLYEVYNHLYEIDDEAHRSPEIKNSIIEQARIELGMKSFLEEGNFSAFTTTFEDLHGMKQLPGLAVQRLMEQGYGFGGEGDWKTAALLRTMKTIANNKGTSFMEDYTYHLDPNNELVLGSHMLEICPTVARTRPEIKVHPLSIGGKQDPARMVFDGDEGAALNASLVDIGNRFRLVINQVDAVRPMKKMPNLPVAKVLWKPKPSLSEAAEAWIHAGGAHHTVFSFQVTPEQLHDWSVLNDIEFVMINESTKMIPFQNELRWNDIARRSL